MLIFLEGLPGSGKTQLITFFALSVPTWEVYANYGIDIPNHTKLELDMFDHLGREDNSIPQLILMDEGYVWIESRTSTAKVNRYLSHNLFQKRKRNQVICVTAQIRGSLDNRFRELAELVIKCKDQEDYYKYTVKKVEENEKTGILELKPKATWRIPKENFEFLYPFYDTYEIVEGLDARDMVIEHMTHEDIIKLANQYVDELLKIQDVWSKPAIEGYLWHHKESTKLAKPILYEMHMKKINLETKKKQLKKGETKQDVIKRIATKLYKEEKKTYPQKEIDAYLYEHDLNPKWGAPIYYRIKKMHEKK